MPPAVLALAEAPAVPKATPTITTVTIPAPPIADILSPSQAKTFLQCTARWYFKYVEQLADIVTGNLAVGRAVHAAVAAYFRAKRDGRVPDLEHVAFVYDSAIAEEIERAELRDDEDAGDLRDTGRRCVEAYVATAADVQPQLVEEWVSGKIGGVAVRGVLDLMDAAGTISDLKTASKKPSGITADYRLQLTMYAMVTPGASGKCRLDTVTKQKTAQVVPQSFDVTARDRQYAEALLPILQDGMKDGRYWPNRDHNLCARKYCPFWRVCESEFGGEVKA